MATDANARFVSPLEGTAKSIFVTSIVCGVISVLVVSIRIYARLYEKALGWDDGLMMAGLAVFVVETVLGCLGARLGLGTRNADLNPTQMVESIKYLMLWMMMYVISLVLIKSSICITMLRVGGTLKSLRISIYVLLGWVIATFIATFVGILCLCSPVEANWNTALIAQGKATCSSVATMIGLSYMSTASSIATDLACAILPGIILWNTQLKLSTKLSCSLLLSFGSFASISTMIRTPSIRYYWTPTDNLAYHVGNIVLWSNVETAIGLVAGSVPALRRLIMRRSFTNQTCSAQTPQNGMKTPTFGSAQPTIGRVKNRSFDNPTDIGISITTIHTRNDGDWRRLHDESFDSDERKKTIHADYTYEVELTRDPEHQSLGSR